MKILNLFFKNINSLEGESRIYFDRPPISGGGVFAITGPNGSGKSSILDAITLGLYGETFRFDKPAEHVITKSQTESFVEIEFSLGEEQYRSSWRVHVKNGKLSLPEMSLTQLNGSEQVIEDSAQKVREKMAELTGMDFHKFSKSMVLAQGDFAAFLNALDSERMDILEKINGSDIYEEYQQQAEEKNNRAQKQLDLLQQDLSSIPVMNEETREASEQDLDDFTQQHAELKVQLSEVQQQLTEIDHINNLKVRVENLEKEQQTIEATQKDNQQTLKNLESTPDIQQFEEDLSIVDAKTENLQQSKKTLDSFHNELEILQKQLKSVQFDETAPLTDKTPIEQKISLEQLKSKLNDLNFNLTKEKALLLTLNQKIEEKKAALDATENWLTDHALDKSLLENLPDTEKLTNLRSELVSLTEKQKSYGSWSKKITENIKKKKAESSKLTTKDGDLKAQVEKNEKALELLSEGNSLQDLQEMESEQQQRVKNFLELYELAKVNEKLGKKGLFGQIFNFKNEKKVETQLKQEREQLQLEIGREQNIAKTLELTLTNELLLKKMQDDRQHLVDGKACPLCGAFEHPYSTHAPAVSNSKQALTDQKKKLKALVSHEASLGKEITSSQQQEAKDVKKDSQLLTIRSQWSNLANRLYAASEDLDIDNISSMKGLLKQEKVELSNLSTLIKGYVKKQQSITQAKLAREANEVTLKRLALETGELDTEWNNKPTESVEQEQALSQVQAQEQVLAEKITEQLTLLGEKLPSKGQEKSLFENLKSRKREYQRQISYQASITEEIKALNNHKNTSTSKVDNVTENSQQYSEQIQQQENVGLHLSLVEKQKLIAEKEAIFSKQEEELATLEQSLLNKTKNSHITNLSVLRENVDTAKQLPEIQQKQTELSEKLLSVQASRKKMQAQLKKDLAKTDQSQNSEIELKLSQKSIKVKLEIAKQEADSLQNKLSKQDSLKEKQEGLLAKIAAQKAEVEVSEADIKLINDDNGHNFRRKVQQGLADKLLSQTNKVLEKISGRYYLRKVESEHGLALEIEDTKQQNARRLPKTLSGGESFIVSLALALSLAEMSSDGHAVDSLFLDEGFGNLDADSLYLAMTTLESLKTHGKMVGIISHVEGVRKRIKTRVEMKKKPNGLSVLKMVS